MTMMCQRCNDAEAQMALIHLGGSEPTENLCLMCYGAAVYPAAPPAPKTPAPTVPDGRASFATVEDAAARAKKVAFYLGQEPSVMGTSAGGFWLGFDSPLVPGFTGANPYEHSRSARARA
jgi:hypothetical protein